MIDLADRRRFYADEIAAVAGLSTMGLVDALAGVERERFLRPGPWLVKGEGDYFSAARSTPDADPCHVYHNYSIAIDPARQLFNGTPAFVATLIDRLALTSGARVLHIGAGLGYYSALLASTVGRSGHVAAIEVDPDLAAQARTNLAAMPWVDVIEADGHGPFIGPFDAILVNAGVTHPVDAWLDALAPGGRMALPLTVAMGGTIGKGIVVKVTREAGGLYSASLVTMVAIYSALGLRDEALNLALGQALRASPFPPLRRLRRDPHDQSAACWLHAPACCFSLE
jgi:protein-L-isoaspartate(D-aspartate) O-methyltransferase